MGTPSKRLKIGCRSSSLKSALMEEAQDITGIVYGDIEIDGIADPKVYLGLLQRILLDPARIYALKIESWSRPHKTEAGPPQDADT